jgi:hypothetical protein
VHLSDSVVRRHETAERWRSLAEKVDAVLEARPRWQWGVAFLCLLLPAIWCARWKPLTHDELFSFEIARLGGLADVWRALSAGADFHPPLDFLVRHLSMSLFGQSEMAFRLPSIAATWITLVCLYSVVARRTSALYGLIAALIPLSTPVFEFAYDGRPYALMVACAAAALAAWQRSTEGSRVALILLAVSLAAGVWAHFYGILAFIPIALGELVRTRTERRLDWSVWIVLALAGAALAPLLPFIRTARLIGAAYWTKVGMLQALSIYSALMEPLCIFVGLVVPVLLASGLSARSRGAARRARRHEIAATAGFLLLPLAAYLLAKSATGALIPRYVLVTAVGISAGLAFAAWEAMGASPATGLVVAAVLGLTSVGHELAFALKQRQLRAMLNRDNLAEIVRVLPGPIAMTDNDLLFPLWHYQPRGVAERLVFVADERAAVEHQGYNTIELLFPRLKLWSERINVESYEEFVQKNRQFLLIDNLRGYVAKLLLRDGATLTAKTSYKNLWVFQVEMSGGASGRQFSAVPPR